MIKETTREHINFGGARVIPRETGIGFILIVLLGLTLRLYGLGLQDLRFEEAAAYLAGITGLAPFDPQLYAANPPLYYDIIYFWTRLHESVWFTRLFEVLCGTAVIGAVYAFTLRIAGHKAALFAAFIQAISPFAIFHSREAGADAFAQLLTIASLVWLERYLDTGNTRTALASLMAQLLAVFTSYAALPLIPAMLTVVHLNRNNQRGIWGEWLALQGLFLAPVALWLYAVFESHMVTAMENLDLIPSGGGIQAAMVFVNTLVYGYFTQNIAAVFLVLPLAVLSVAGIADAAGRRLAIYLFVPLLLMIAFINGFLLPRHLFVFAPVLIILAGVGFAVLNVASFRAIAAIWVSAGIAICAAPYYADDATAASSAAIRKEYSRASDYLDTRLNEGDTLYHAGKNSTAPMIALHPGRWRHQWLAPDDRIPPVENLTARIIAPRSYGNGPAYPAWVLFSSAGMLPFHDVEPAAVRYRIERFAAPMEAAHFKGITAIRYIPYETGRLDRVEDESGGRHLFRDRETGEEFPANYRSLSAAFTGTTLRLTPNAQVEVSTVYPEASLSLMMVGGFPLVPDIKLSSNFIFAPDGYANSFCFTATVSPQQPAILYLTSGAYIGDYRLFARVMHGDSRGAAIQAFVGTNEVTLQPIIPSNSQTDWQWLDLGAVSYDGTNPISLKVTAAVGQTAEAAIQSVFLIPVEGGKLSRKNFTLREGEVFQIAAPPNGIPLTAIVTDNDRRELLSAFRTR